MVQLVKNRPANAGAARDTGSIFGPGRSPGVCEPIKEGFEFSCSEAIQANACLSVVDLSSRSFQFVSTAIGFSYESWQVLCGIDVNTSGF